MKSQEVIAAVQECRRFGGVVWFEELRVGTGFGNGRERSIDLWGISTQPSDKARTISIEVKVSKSDFAREIANPEKRRGALLHSNQFFFAAPAGIIDPKKLPPECGLIEVELTTDDRWGYRTENTNFARVIIDAPFEERFPPSWHFMASLCRQLHRNHVDVDGST